MLPENCFLFTRDVVQNLTESRMYGYGVTSDAVIVGTEGFRAFKEAGGQGLPDEGRFCGVFVENDGSIIFKTDVTGQEILYLFQNGDDWAVSNSFLLLAEEASRRTKLHLYEPAVVSFHLKRGVHIGEQLLSHRTMVKEITIVPITSQLRVSRQTLALVIESASFFDVFSFEEGMNYSDTLIEMLETGAGLTRAMADLNCPLNLYLSGGYDSRLTLSIILANQPVIDRLQVTSFEGQTQDFCVAQSICQRLDLPLNTQAAKPKRTLSDTDALRVYMLSCGGTYLPMYPLNCHYVDADAEIRVTGDQPTSWDFYLGHGQFNGSVDAIRKDIDRASEERGFGPILSQEFLSTFRDLDVDPKHPAAMRAYYCATRSRHHCGRSWYRSLGAAFILTPLMQRRFVALDLWNLAQGYPPQKIFADAFSATGGWTLEEPFETEDRTFDRALLDRSPFKGGATVTPKQFRVFGSLQNYQPSTTDLFSVELSFSARPENIKRNLAELFYQTERARASGLFTEEDYSLAKMETRAEGSLSHNYRRVCHILFAETVLRLIERSK